MAHQVTKDTKDLIVKAARCGVSRRKMCLLVGVSHRTLVKYYEALILSSEVVADQLVVDNLFKIATGGSPQAVVAAIWWTKARMGWKEQPVELGVTFTFEQDASQFDAKVTEMLAKVINAKPDNPKNPGTEPGTASSTDEGAEG